MAEHFGPYELRSLVGRGGMGEVYRAVDTRKNRGLVALKRLPAGLADDETFHRRFLQEAELAARLRDPHVIPIHDYGEIAGQPYLEMRLVDGVDLGTVLARHGALPPERAVAVVTQIAGALDAAHREGLVHRDVKPQNVLIHGGDSDADFVYLIDFGIAANLLSSRRSSSMVSGTVAYMAPERFTSGGDHRVDVYALGCLLYESLTGELPFTGDFMQLMAAHAHSDPPAPSARRSGLPRGLDDVVRHAMAKDPHRRFATPGALAASAKAAVAETRTPATPPPPRHRGGPDAPEHAAPAYALVQGHVPTVTGHGHRPGPTPAGTQAIRTVDDRRGRWFHRLAYGPEGEFVAALPRSGGIVLLDPVAGTVVGEVGDERVFSAVQFSPDGDLLAVGTDRYGTGDVVLWDTETWEEFGRAARHDGPVTSLAFSADGRFLASGGADHVAVTWDIDRDRRFQRCPHRTPVHEVAFSPDGRWVASAADDVRLFDATARSRWARPARVLGLGTDARSVSFSPDGHRLVAAGASHAVTAWDVASGRALATLPHGAEVCALVHVPCSGQLVTAGGGGLRLWRAGDYAPARAFDAGIEVEAIAGHPNRPQVAVAGADGVVRIVDL